MNLKEYAKNKVGKFLREVVFSEKINRWVRNLTESTSGANVDSTTIFNLSSVYASVRNISEDIGMMPINLYERLDEGKRKADDHPLHSLLRIAPNPLLTPMQFKETAMAHLLTWGNAYAEKEYDVAGRVIALWPIHPSRVTPFRVRLEKWYRIQIPNAAEVELPASHIFALHGLSFDGLVGVSPLTYCREVYGSALATQEYANRYYSGDANPGGVLSHPNRLGDEAYNRLKASIEKEHMGLERKHRFMLLEEGLKWEKIGLSPQDSQMLESRKFSVEEIARIYRIPLHKIQSMDRATFSNIEHQSIEYVTNTISPWTVRWEEAITQQLLNNETQFYPKFLMAALLRGDIKSRFEAYAVGRQWGWYNVDEIRELEDMNPLPNKTGKTYLVPSNMIEVGGKPKPVEAGPAIPEEEPQETIDGRQE